ncbi:MAG: D-2-hydroxyacid dehydrogenase [Oscillospiraceae bacterium]
MKIAINAPFSGKNIELIRRAAPGCEVVCGLENSTGAEIFVGNPSDMPDTSALKLFQSTSAGVEKLLAKELPGDVIITNTTGAFGGVIAEYILAGLLAISRDLFRYKEQQRRHVWEPLDGERMLYGKNALLLGCGDLGSETARRLHAFGVSTTGIRRSPAPVEGFDQVFGVDMLNELLPESDIVICCLPHTAHTTGMLDRQRLGLMKRGAMFVNVGRGSLVDTQALVQLLENGSISGAVLDVFDIEPLPESSPLWDMENVLITPHISGPSFGHFQEVERLITDICTDNISRYLTGKPLRNVVSRESGYCC